VQPAAIQPVPPADQTQSSFDLFLIFVGANIVATTFQVGASLAESFSIRDALVLVGGGIDGGYDYSEEMQQWDAEEEAALERGDFDAAADVMVRAWVAGPRRSVEAVDPALRDLVVDMQRNAYELQEGREVHVNRLDPPAWQRLHDVRVPTLVLTGDEDFADVHRIADKLTAEIPNAERATIANAAHLPNLERPDEFDRIVLGFLARSSGV
jgi:pimeloyl-ACP methyl ester carboxylesterase